MIKKILMTFFALFLLTLAGYLLYELVPKEPIKLAIIDSGIISKKIEVNYNNTPVFAKNLRFNHNLISYYIEPDCPETRKTAMKNAFAIFHNEMNIVSFYESEKDRADILVGCSENYISEGERMFRAGEGGPSRYLNGSLFNIILEGKIILYQDSKCDYPIVEMHELLHVFGFDHSENKKSLMYPVSNCNQEITEDMIETINSLYSIEPLPDLLIDSIEATKKRYYLDFNITIKNQGLTDAEDAVLFVLMKNEIIKEFPLGNVTILSFRTLTVENLKLPYSDNEIKFEISSKENKEIDFSNNAVTVSVVD